MRTKYEPKKKKKRRKCSRQSSNLLICSLHELQSQKEELLFISIYLKNYSQEIQ